MAAANTTSASTVEALGSATGAPDPETILQGWKLDFARFVWLSVLFGSVLCFVSGIPRSYTIASALSTSALNRLAQMGLPPTFGARYLIVLDTATFTLFVVAAIIIFRKRSNERLALTAAFMLIFTGMLYTAPGYEARIPITLIALGAAVAEFFQLLFLLIFPDGRIRPGWIWLFLPLLAAWRFFMWRVYYIPWLYAASRTGDRYPFLRQDTRDLLVFFLVLMLAVLLQIHRYRNVSNTEEKLQAKWLVWATSMTVIIVGAYVIAVNSLPAMHPRLGSSVIVGLAGRTVRQTALCIIPVAILYSVLRRRLWNIDFLINRTLVYVPLTSVMAGIFVVVVTLSQRFMLAATGVRSESAILFVSVLLTTLVTPIRSEIQKWVDARFKEAPDPMLALKRLDTDVRDVADILTRESLLTRMVDDAVRALGAAGGAAYRIDGHKPLLIHSTPGWYGPITLQRPLVSGGQCAGWLALGMKHNGAAYSAAETKSLDETLGRVAHVLVMMYGSRHVQTARVDAESIVLPLPVQPPAPQRAPLAVFEPSLVPAEVDPAPAVGD